MYRCESWTIKKAEHRTEAFKLGCWRRLLRVPWRARRSNQSIPKEVNLEYSLEGLMPKLKLQYFGHLMQRADSLEKTLMLRRTEGRRRGWQDEMVGWHHWLNGYAFEQALGDGEGQGSLACCRPWGRKELDTTEQLNKRIDTFIQGYRNMKMKAKLFFHKFGRRGLIEPLSDNRIYIGSVTCRVVKWPRGNRNLYNRRTCTLGFLSLLGNLSQTSTCEWGAVSRLSYLLYYIVCNSSHPHIRTWTFWGRHCELFKVFSVWSSASKEHNIRSG